MGGPGIFRDRLLPRLFGRALVGAVVFGIFLGFIL
jgi:hypothetical protein